MSRTIRATSQILDPAVDFDQGLVAGRWSRSNSPTPQIGPPASPICVLHPALCGPEAAETAAARGRSRHRALVLGMVSLVWANTGNIRAADVIAESHFDNDDEGWKQHKEALAPRAVVYEPLGGFSGGGIKSDKDADWFVAPASFLGDQRAAYGGMLRFVIKQNKGPGAANGFTARLESGGLLIGRYIVGIPPTTFGELQFVLDENSGWFNRGTAKLATRAEMLTVLSNLQILHIRASYTGATDDVTWLDDVVLQGPPTPSVLSLDPGQVLTIQGEPGDNYDVQFAPQLGRDAAWQPLVGITLPAVPDPNLSIRLYDAATGGTNRFFRAVRRP